MNVRISTEHKFLAGFWWAGELSLNHYQIKVDMTTATEDVVEQNTAFLRLRHIIESTLDNTIFINYNETDVIENYRRAGIKLALLPEDPVDQIVGMVLHSKLSTVMENRIMIRCLRLSSVKGDNVVYEHGDVEYNPFYKTAGWWGDLDPDNTENTGSTDPMQINLTTVSANRHWRDLGLGWDSEENENDQVEGNILVFNGFKRDAD